MKGCMDFCTGITNRWHVDSCPNRKVVEDDAERLFPRLEAIDYKVVPDPHVGGRFWAIAPSGKSLGLWLNTEAEAKAACLAHSRSPEGIVLTMDAKMAWLGYNYGVEVFWDGPDEWCAATRPSPSAECVEVRNHKAPKAAVNALFEAVT